MSISTISSLFLSSFIPQSIQFETKSTKQEWSLTRASGRTYRLSFYHYSTAPSPVSIIPACFPFKWTKGSGSFYSMTLESVILMLKDPDVNIIHCSNSPAATAILKEMLLLSPADFALYDSLKSKSRIALKSAVNQIYASDFPVSVRGVYSNHSDSQGLDFEVHGVPSSNSGIIKCIVRFNLVVSPQAPNFLQLILANNSDSTQVDPNLLINLFTEFKKNLIIEGYSFL